MLTPTEDLAAARERCARLAGDLLPALAANPMVVRAGVGALLDLGIGAHIIRGGYADWRAGRLSAPVAIACIAEAAQEVLSVNGDVEDALTRAIPVACCDEAGVDRLEWRLHCAFYAHTAPGTGVDDLVADAAARAAGEATAAGLALYAATSAIALEIFGMGEQAKDLIRESDDAHSMR